MGEFTHMRIFVCKFNKIVFIKIKIKVIINIKMPPHDTFCKFIFFAEFDGSRRKNSKGKETLTKDAG